MKTHITVALMAISLLTAVTPPATAFELGIGANGFGFPNENLDNDPTWHDTSNEIYSQPAIKKGMTIPGSDTASGPTIIDSHGIDVDGPVVPYSKPKGGISIEGVEVTTSGGRLAAVCAVAGTPVEFPDDIVVTNVGDRTIPAGALVSWRTAAPQVTGKAQLAKPLHPGRSAQLRNAIPGGADPETTCNIRAIIT